MRQNDNHHFRCNLALKVAIRTNGTGTAYLTKIQTTSDTGGFPRLSEQTILVGGDWTLKKARYSKVIMTTQAPAEKLGSAEEG